MGGATPLRVAVGNVRGSKPAGRGKGIKPGFLIGRKLLQVFQNAKTQSPLRPVRAKAHTINYTTIVTVFVCTTVRGQRQPGPGAGGPVVIFKFNITRYKS